MSVINRMLADLEQRGAPAARAAGALHSPALAARRRARRQRPAMIVLLLALIGVAVALWLPPGVLHMPARGSNEGAAAPARGEQAARRVPIASNAAPERVREVPAAPVRATSTQPVIKVAMRADSSGATTASTTSNEPVHPATGVPVIAKPPLDASRGGALGGIKLPAGTLSTLGERAPVTHSSSVVRKDHRSTDAQRAQRHHASARELIARGDNGAARVQLREAIALDPRLHEARDVLVALLRRSGEHAEARELLAQGLELAPGRAGFATPYARLLVDAGELERASQVLVDAYASGAGDAQYHALAGAIAQQLGQHDAAVAQYTRAIEARPDQQGRLWLGLGISLAANGRDVDARHAFRAALDSGDLPERLHAWARGRIE